MIDTECYLMIDGDDTYPVEMEYVLVDVILKEHIDMVVENGLFSMYFEEYKCPFHNTESSLVKMFVNYLFHCDIYDIMVRYWAFSHQFVKYFLP